MASLSLAIDLGMGLPFEWMLRCCLVAVRLAERLGLSEHEQRDAYYLALLRHIGCTGNSHTDAILFGNELIGADGMSLDMDDMQVVMRFLTDSVGRNSVGERLPEAEREAMLARLFAGGPALFKANHVGHCEVGQKLAATLGFAPHIQQALLDMYERWDGKGDVTQRQGEAIPLAVRIAHVAQDAATFGVNNGAAVAAEVVRARAGRMLDPAIADVFLSACQRIARRRKRRVVLGCGAGLRAGRANDIERESVRGRSPCHCRFCGFEITIYGRALAARLGLGSACGATGWLTAQRCGRATLRRADAGYWARWRVIGDLGQAGQAQRHRVGTRADASLLYGTGV